MAYFGRMTIKYICTVEHSSKEKSFGMYKKCTYISLRACDFCCNSGPQKPRAQSLRYKKADENKGTRVSRRTDHSREKLLIILNISHSPEVVSWPLWPGRGLNLIYYPFFTLWRYSLWGVGTPRLGERWGRSTGPNSIIPVPLSLLMS